MSTSNGKGKVWKRAAEILDRKYGFKAPEGWSLSQLQMKLKTEAAKKPPETKAATVEPTKAEVVLPATQRLDVQAPVMNVHVPAPSVTMGAESWSLRADLGRAFTYIQALAIGFSLHAWLPSIVAFVGGQ